MMGFLALVVVILAMAALVPVMTRRMGCEHQGTEQCDGCPYRGNGCPEENNDES